MSVFITPLPKGELSGNQFDVTVNGDSLPLHKAWVSAIPFNRWWPGHQRDVSQREEINFASFSMDAPVEFEIRPNRTFENVVVRPLSLGIVPEIENGVIRFTLPKPAYFTVELDDLHQALHIFADLYTDYKLNVEADNVLYFGPGVHEAGIIHLYSGQTLYLDEGAVVYGNVCAREATNIQILGRGILDNSHNVEERMYSFKSKNDTDRGIAIDNTIRLCTIQIDRCQNVKIDGITIRDSMVYNIRPTSCNDVEICHVKIIGSWRYNSDGIDMHNCTRVHIADCFVRTFDDCICAKGFDGYENPALRDGHKIIDKLIVERCVLWNDWDMALEIGAETRAEEICNIIWRDCDIIHGTHVFLDAQNVDQADIHDWLIENIRCEYDERAMQPAYQFQDDMVYDPCYEEGYEPVLFSATVSYNQDYSESTLWRGRFRRIRIRNIHINAKKAPVLRFGGFDAGHLCEDVTVDGIYNGIRRLSPEEIVVQCNEFTKDIRIL